MSERKEPTGEAKLRFEPWARRGRANDIVSGEQLEAASRLARLSDFQQEVAAALPRAELVETNHEAGRHRGSGAGFRWLSQLGAAIQGPRIYAEVPASPCEGTYFLVPVTLCNLGASELNGTLRALINGASS